MTAQDVRPPVPAARPRAPRVEVVEAGFQTSVQDLPGRVGLWSVGVPPSGAWDDLSFALANRAVGNDPGAAGLEAVVGGPVLRFTARTLVCVTGAVPAATLNGRPVEAGVVTVVPAGGVLDVGPLGGPGMRGYVAVRGGLDVPAVLGSRSAFLLGGFGGGTGRALRDGDVLAVRSEENCGAPADVAPLLPRMGGEWRVRVIPGPHGAPEYLTEQGVAALFDAAWRVDHRSDRTGVRLIGPAPGWSRADGGEAGMHPSNLHDSAYPVGGIMLSGDTPVVVGPDGPSLGGFVVPAVVVRADRWMFAQARPGDVVRLCPVTPDEAAAANRDRRRTLADVPSALARALPVTGPAPSAGSPPRPARPVDAGPSPRAAAPQAEGLPHRSAPPARGGLSREPAPGSPKTGAEDPPRSPGPVRRGAPLLNLSPDEDRPALVARRAGDHHLLVEVGPAELDLTVRLKAHLLAQGVAARGLRGLRESVEGVRSLLLAVDETMLPLPRLADVVAEVWSEVGDVSDVALPVREVTLPLSLDDPAAHEAMTRYARAVRPDAPWCPDNVEFIRRVNGLEARDDVFDVVLSATYLVIGLGDVYLGAPVAVPLDPRHRLVTTKYDPARTWTPANAVGIGGVYLCVYGMEGPGGYQLVGRTVPVWRFDPAGQSPPWLLRHFDMLRFRPVGAGELLDLRADIAAGRRDLETRPATLRPADLHPPGDPAAAAFTARRDAAFARERARWEATA